MKKIVAVLLFIISLFLLCSCGMKIQVEQIKDVVEVGAKNVIWNDFISMEDAQNYKVSCDASEVDMNQPGEYSLRYSFENKKSKKQASKEFIIKVVDTTAPDLHLNKESVEVVEGSAFDPTLYITVNDNSNSIEVEDVTIDNPVDISKIGNYTVTYSVSDASGNKTQATMEVVVVEKMTPAKMDAELKKQPIYVKSTKYVVQDSRYKSLYPDMLRAVLKNESGVSIKNAVVAFVAWDKNDLPVKIKGDIDFSDGYYVREVNYNDINLVAGKEYGRNSGYEIDDGLGIKTFKAMVISYEDFSGEVWENPLYDKWLELYEGQQYVW